MRILDDTQRTMIVGRTGSGKTVAGAYHMSFMAFDEKPVIIYDFKRDQLLSDIADLKGCEHIDTSFVPRKPGLYFVHPGPDDSPQVTAQMWEIWRQENIGVYIDEGYMVSGGRNPAFRALLTQGRSKRIPMIILSQRPVWLDKFAFSEADFYQLFALNFAGDRKTIMEYIPDDLSKPLPKYHSYYHDVAEAETVVMKPVPTGDALLTVFDTRLSAMRKRTRRVAI